MFGTNWAMQSPVWTTRPESWWALLGEWAEIPVECLQCLVASKTRSLAAIIGARGGNIPYWLGIHKTTPTGSIMQKLCLFDEIYHNHHPMISRYAHAANFSNINKFHRKYKDYVYRKMLVQEYLKKWRIFKRVKPKNDMMYHDIYNCICQNTKK